MSELDESNRQFIAAWQLFAKRAKHGTIDDRDGISVAFSGVTLPLLNMAFLSSPVTSEADLQARIVRALAAGASSQQMWLLTLCEDWLPEALRARAPKMLADVGLVPTSLTTGMVAEDLAPARRPAPPELTICAVDSATSRRAVADLNTIAYHMPVEWGHEAMTHEELFAGDLWADVGYIDDVPVSTSTTALIDERLYVMMVATSANQMNKGYAEAVMRHSLVRAAAATKIRRSVLHASEAGKPLYASMGYRATSQFTMYMQPPPA